VLPAHVATKSATVLCGDESETMCTADSITGSMASGGYEGAEESPHAAGQANPDLVVANEAFCKRN
jgi:hypothetical protein